jgi:hypothetical protein
MKIINIIDTLWTLFGISFGINCLLLVANIFMLIGSITSCDELLYSKVVNITKTDKYICNVTLVPLIDHKAPWDKWSQLIECNNSPKVDEKVLTMFNHFRGPKGCFGIITNPTQKHEVEMFNYQIFNYYFCVVLTSYCLCLFFYGAYRYLSYIESRRNAAFYAAKKKIDDL